MLSLALSLKRKTGTLEEKPFGGRWLPRVVLMSGRVSATCKKPLRSHRSSQAYGASSEEEGQAALSPICRAHIPLRVLILSENRASESSLRFGDKSVGNAIAE